MTQIPIKGGALSNPKQMKSSQWSNQVDLLLSLVVSCRLLLSHSLSVLSSDVGRFKVGSVNWIKPGLVEGTVGEPLVPGGPWVEEGQGWRLVGFVGAWGCSQVVWWAILPPPDTPRYYIPQASASTTLVTLMPHPVFTYDFMDWYSQFVIKDQFSVHPVIQKYLSQFIT